MKRQLLTVFGLGLLKPAPGTWGSLPMPLIALLLVWLALPAWMVSVNVALVGLVFAIACVRFGHYGESMFGRKDAPQIVCDEMAGQAIPLIALPWAASMSHNALLAGIAFATFRAFDITKPPPINGLQRIPGGWGVLIDDLIAGVWAAIVTQLIARLLLE